MKKLLPFIIAFLIVVALITVGLILSRKDATPTSTTQAGGTVTTAPGIDAGGPSENDNEVPAEDIFD